MIKILLVDDHALFRKGLRSLIETSPDMAVVGEASDVSGASKAYRATLPDVTLMDMRLPDGDGLQALENILAYDGDARIIMLSAFDFADQVASCMRAGARGYLSKNLDPQELFRSIETVNRGGTALDAAYLSALFAEDHADRHDRVDVLTPRELEVAELVAKGKTNREIADVLCVSPLTVKAHVTSIFSKLELHSRVELTAWFLTERNPV